MTSKKAGPDWEAIERDYRAGIKSLREIAAKDGQVTEGAIRKRAKRDGWERNLANKIKAKAEALVRKAVVRKAGTQQLSPATEREVIEDNAQQMAEVALLHRSGARKVRTLGMKLLAELEAASEDPELLTKLRELAISPDDDPEGRLRAMFDRLMSLPGRTKTYKDLVEATRVAIAIERQALGMDEAGRGATDYEDTLTRALSDGADT